MSSHAYSEILNQFHYLDPDAQQRLLHDLAGLVDSHEGQPKRSVLELQGLGKQLWQKIEIEDYIDRESSSWNG